MAVMSEGEREAITTPENLSGLSGYQYWPRLGNAVYIERNQTIAQVQSE